MRARGTGPSPSRPADAGTLRALTWALVLIAFAAVILASREHAWAIGHWSQDLSPVPILGGIALLSTALDRLGAPGGTASAEGESGFGFGADLLRWQLLGAALAAFGLALLGRSGLALALAAAMAAALAITYATRPSRAAR